MTKKHIVNIGSNNKINKKRVNVKILGINVLGKKIIKNIKKYKIMNLVMENIRINIFI